MRAALLLTAAVALGPGAGTAAAADVLVVGDSLEVGTGPHLKRELADREVEVDARTGRPSDEGLRVLRSRLRPDHRVVVFDLGTNDDPSRPGTLRASLGGALSLAGGRCLVISTLRRPPLNGVPVDGLNAVIDEVAASPAVQVVDWRGATAQDPGLMAPDGVHARPAAYARRAKLVAEAVRACDAEPAAAPGPRAPRPQPRRPAPRPRRLAVSLGPLGALIQEAGARVSAALEAAAAALLPEPPEPELGSPDDPLG